MRSTPGPHTNIRIFSHTGNHMKAAPRCKEFSFHEVRKLEVPRDRSQMFSRKLNGSSTSSIQIFSCRTPTGMFSPNTLIGLQKPDPRDARQKLMRMFLSFPRFSSNGRNSVDEPSCMAALYSFRLAAFPVHSTETSTLHNKENLCLFCFLFLGTCLCRCFNLVPAM